jgi:preprotein translocase subunit Sec61beta
MDPRFQQQSQQQQQTDPSSVSGWGVLIAIVVFIISLIIYLIVHIGIVVAGLYVYNKWKK